MAESTIKITVIANVAQSVKELQKVCSLLDSIKDASGGVSEATKAVQEQLKGVGEGGKEASQGLDEAGESAKSSGNKAKQSESFWSKLGRSLKRIFLYRTIRKLLSEIGQSAREGIDNIYEWSSAVGNFDTNNTKKNLDNLSSAVLFLSNAIGASLSSAFDAILPHVTNFIKAIAKAFNTLSMFFSALMGKDTYVYAVEDVFDSWDTKAGSATQSAKELRRVLLGFDEINRLDMKTDTSSGGGAGASTSTNDMFDRGDVTGKMKKVADTVKEIIPYLQLAGAILLSWKIGESLFNGFNTLNNWLGTTEGKAVKTKLAIAGIALGCGIATDGIKKMLETDGDLLSYGESLLGMGIIGLSVGTIFGGTAGLIVSALGIVGASIVRCVEVWNASGYKWSDICEAMGVTIGELPEGVRNALRTVALIFETQFENISENITRFVNTVGGIWKNIFPNSKTFHLNWTYEQLPKGTLRYQILDALGLPTQMPRLHIQYYSQGGVVSKPTLLGFNGMNAMVGGERGAEAIVPLERNTEWLDKIADRLSRSQGEQRIIINMDGKSVYDVVVERNNSQVRRTGKSALLT